MSREIKFRCWNNCTREYIPQDELMDNFGEYLKEGHLYIEQYTGLKDKNGKEVYEGDIVKVSSNGIAPVNCTVKWDKETAAFELEVCEEIAFAFGNRELEVIGNIHELPKDFRPEHLKRMGISISKGGEE